ncbi:hypothetical protein AB205_0142790, partial [Aquarana catesbeiana]
TTYKKQFEENKGNYHFGLGTAEQIHHKENAVLQSQVKYKENYEKSKGKSMLEFVDTPSYYVSKEAQKMQSEKCLAPNDFKHFAPTKPHNPLYTEGCQLSLALEVLIRPKEAWDLATHITKVTLPYYTRCV